MFTIRLLPYQKLIFALITDIVRILTNLYCSEKNYDRQDDKTLYHVTKYSRLCKINRLFCQGH